MHISEEGFIAYAMKIEAIQDRLSDDISIDMLSRLLVDVHQDSSNIAESLLSFFQKQLLSMIYNGDEVSAPQPSAWSGDCCRSDLIAANSSCATSST